MFSYPVGGPSLSQELGCNRCKLNNLVSVYQIISEGQALIFFSLVFWFSPFSAAFLCFSRGFEGFRGGKKSLVFRVVFLGFYLNTKEKSTVSKLGAL